MIWFCDSCGCQTATSKGYEPLEDTLGIVAWDKDCEVATVQRILLKLLEEQDGRLTPHNWKVLKAFVANTPRGKIPLGTMLVKCSVCDFVHERVANGTLTVDEIEKRGFENFREPDCDAEVVKKVMGY